MSEKMSKEFIKEKLYLAADVIYKAEQEAIAAENFFTATKKQTPNNEHFMAIQDLVYEYQLALKDMLNDINDATDIIWDLSPNVPDHVFEKVSCALYNNQG